MDLAKLFQLQRQLDERIEQEHPRQPGEDRLAKKILALLVELGELANEARFFKFWSHDQEPRMEKEVFCTVCDGTGTPLGIPEESGVDCYQCDGAGSYFINPLLEKYVDGLYLLLSIGLEIGCDQNLTIGNVPRRDSLIDMFKDVFKQVSVFDLCINDLKYRFKDTPEYNVHRVHYSILLDLYLELGQMLGFTWEEIEGAYLQKNQENFKRQEEGY